MRKAVFREIGGHRNRLPLASTLSERSRLNSGWPIPTSIAPLETRNGRFQKSRRISPGRENCLYISTGTWTPQSNDYAARELQSRNHDVVFISLPDGECSVRAARLPFLPCAVKRIPSWLAHRTPPLAEQTPGRGGAASCTTECCHQDRSDVEFVTGDVNCSRGRCSRTRHRSDLH